MGLQFSTVIAPRLPATPHKISNSLPVSFLTKISPTRYYMTRTYQASPCSSFLKHWFNDARSFHFKTWSKASTRRKEKTKRSCTPPTYIKQEGATTLHEQQMLFDTYTIRNRQKKITHTMVPLHHSPVSFISSPRLCPLEIMVQNM